MHKSSLEQVARQICDRRGTRFVKQVGEGTFKETFQVAEPDKTHSALKIYKATTASARDEREIRAMRQCSHRNIARIISVETISYGGQQFIAITEEFLSGGTLTAKGRLTVSECLAIGGQLIDAVAHIAGLSLVHRDIKPDNIMFRSDGMTPVLTDFGVVRDLSDSSITPTWVARGPGTPFFSSPEQLNNQKNLIDWRTDQFALGIAMAYTVFGEHPYRIADKSDRELLEAVSSRRPPAKWFLEKTSSLGLISFPRMVAPWPVDRYRKPQRLKQGWAAQKG